MQKIKVLCLITLTLLCLSGCSASVFIPPLPGPTMIPSALASIYTAYAIGADERGFQTIIEDEMIETKIQSKIFHQKDLKILNVSAYSYNGNVYVIGQYDDKKDLKRIKKIVKKSGKVNSLTTFMLPQTEESSCSTAEDYLLQMQVKEALLEDDSVWGTNIAVKSVQCNIVLLGRVGNINEITHAKQIASTIDGVNSVKSFIKSSKQNKYNMTPKQEIAFNK